MKIDMDEILTGLMFVVLGYFIAMIFHRMCSCNGNGFSVSAALDPNHCYDSDFNTEALCNDNQGHCKWISASIGTNKCCTQSDNSYLPNNYVCRGNDGNPIRVQA